MSLDRMPDDLAERTARLVNAVEDQLAAAQDDKKQVYADLREELKSLGMGGAEISKEVAAFKAAIAETRRSDEQRLAAGEKADRADELAAIIRGSRARARARGGNADAKLIGTVATAMQTEIGRKALTSALDVMIEREEITETPPAHTEVGSEQAAASAPLGAAADHSGSSSGRTADFDSANGGSIPSPEANSPETATKQRENAPSQHEVRPGSTSLGTEQQCDTLGVTAGRDPQPNQPETANEHPHRLETTRGDESGTLEGSVEDHGQAAGRYPESRTDGIGNRDSAERRAPHSPEATASPVALVIHHDESREARSLRLRPHCQNPSVCAGVGTTHCYSCKRAITSMNGGDAA